MKMVMKISAVENVAKGVAVLASKSGGNLQYEKSSKDIQEAVRQMDNTIFHRPNKPHFILCSIT